MNREIEEDIMESKKENLIEMLYEYYKIDENYICDCLELNKNEVKDIILNKIDSLDKNNYEYYLVIKSKLKKIIKESENNE